MNTLSRINSMPTLFDTFFGPSYAPRPYVTRYAKPAVASPAVNIRETETAYHIEVAAPGAKKENFTLSVDQQVLTLSFKNEADAEAQKDAYVRQEFSFQAFERGFRLPKTVNVDAIRATYTDGILSVELPKMEEAKPVIKHIEVA